MSTTTFGNNTFPASLKIDRQVTIAVVDDHALIREKISELLAECGFTVTIQAKHGLDLLEKLKDTPAPDVCLLDISMPIMNGYETAAQLKQQYPQIKILAFSADNEEAGISKILECGAHGFAEKNINPVTLRDKIMELL